MKSSKGEQAWRLIVQQKSALDVSAAILRVDGDTGSLTGGYKDGNFVLSHFSGGRPALLILTPAADGTLAIDMTDLHGKSQLTATRPDVARAKGLPPPDRSGSSHHRQGRLRTISVQFPRSQRQNCFEHRRPLSRQGGAGERYWKLVPQLPRRSAVLGRTVSQISQPGPGSCSTFLRGRRSAQESGTAARLYEGIWNRLHRVCSAACRTTAMPS